jgi:hypothetical protein
LKIHIYTIGSCRGSGFTGSVTVTLKQLETLIERCNDPEEAEDIAESLFGDYRPFFELSHLFYNVGYSNETLKKMLTRIKKGKQLIEVWEEGTTGIGLDKKQLRLEVKSADSMANNGNGLRGDIIRISKLKR